MLRCNTLYKTCTNSIDLLYLTYYIGDIEFRKQICIKNLFGQENNMLKQQKYSSYCVTEFS